MKLSRPDPEEMTRLVQRAAVTLASAVEIDKESREVKIPRSPLIGLVEEAYSLGLRDAKPPERIGEIKQEDQELIDVVADHENRLSLIEGHLVL